MQGDNAGIARLIDEWLAASPTRSLSQLALKAGVHRSTVVRWHKGERKKPRGDQARRLASALGVPLERVLRAVQKPLPPPRPITFEEWIQRDWRLTAKQREVLLMLYYDIFLIRDRSGD